MKLKFGKGNAKLGSRIRTFSLPAGWSCPFALECKSKVVLLNGSRKIRDGSATKFRCFAASSEVVYPAVYDARQHNWNALKTHRRSIAAMASLISSSIPGRTKWVRIHVSGDFFSQKYFDAWLKVARSNPNILFYAYTKSLLYWVSRLDSIPTNLILTASFGGKTDYLIEKHSLRYAKVVFSEEEAATLGLPIDHDDSHAYTNGGSFALLLHGIQPAKSKSAEALKKLKGKGSYSRKRKVKNEIRT